MRREPVTADGSMFTFYDIESLSNAFTICAYMPVRDEPKVHLLEIFYLIDDPSLVAQIDFAVLYDRIVAANPAMGPTSFVPWNLATQPGASRLAQLVGASTADQVCDPTDLSRLPVQFRPVCDTDTDYNPMTSPFLAGYNSQNYDTVMLAQFLAESFPVDPTQQNGPVFQPASAAELRRHNDLLYSTYIDYMPKSLGYDSPAAVLRKNMLASGRHLDVARLNEAQVKVALKRQLGMLGRQILESEKLSQNTVIESIEHLYDLLAYNVSDCVGLSHLFDDPTYINAFDLKAGLVARYDETRRLSDGTVRKDRLSIDSSSAKLVGRILSPYGHLDDAPVVSFNYPHPEVAAQRGVPVTNVLDDTERYFRQNIADPDDPSITTLQKQAWARFSQVLAFYREIEGKNFNDSPEYQQRHGPTHTPHELKEITKRALNVPYFCADGSPDSCFVTFSTGGIHGAETNAQAVKDQQEQYAEQAQQIRMARGLFAADAQKFLELAKDQHNVLTLPDGRRVDKRLVLIGSDPEKVRYRKPKAGVTDEASLQREQLAAAQAQLPDPADLLATQREATMQYDVVLADGLVLEAKTVLTSNRKEFREAPGIAAPTMFQDKDDGSNVLDKRFTFTSAGLVVHEDFTSYYPNLLRNMRAFYNKQLGEDRYASIYFQKEELGKQLKDPSLTKEQRTALTNARNGTKLILNSASGAGDASHKTPIRMNNTIIAMRIIGQLLTWRIGQAQTLAGGRIISTNTDGLYSVIDHDGTFDVATNNRVLQEQQAAIGVDIEPELMFLISKDSNNRMELMPPRGVPELEDAVQPQRLLRDDGGFEIQDLEITAAGGGSLACFTGPLATKSLSHPAVLDRGLAHYLKRLTTGGQDRLRDAFDPELGRQVIEEAIDHSDPVQTLRMFQNVLAASRGSITYPFAATHMGAQIAAEQADGGTAGDELVEPRALQMYNRVFVVREGTPGAVNLHMAAAPKVSAASQQSRAKNGQPGSRHDPVAQRILAHHGWATTRADLIENPSLQLIPEDRDIAVRKINSIDPRWPMRIVNDDLYCLSDQAAAELIDSLDLEIYTQMLEATFTKNWRNS